MLIVADENIPCATELFGRLGEVRLAPGRTMTSEMVRDADALMVRSVTQVGPALLEGSRVRFVGTATIGSDHIDLRWLAARGIGFAAVPGCNAESVAQYVAAALVWAAGRQGRAPSDCSIGIVGVGNCGRRVERVARALGMQVVLNDPPLARQTGDPVYRPLTDLLDCDYLALHVPLTREGPDKTWRLIDNPVFDTLKPGCTVINASRGFVVDETALLTHVRAGHLAPPVLDAWENEPRIDRELLAETLIGTPHIAGYSYDGKLAGTRAIYEAACEHFGIAPQSLALTMPSAAVSRIGLDSRGRTIDSVLTELILTACPLLRDDADMRRAYFEIAGDQEAAARRFDGLRKNYPLRREFSATRVSLPGASAPLVEAVRQLGFTLDES